MNYYNEIDPYCIAWLKNLITARLIPRGDVDGRRIEEVRPHELNGYTHCHFFAGIGGWAYAAKLAGWPDWRPLWTGSCPCQPFSVVGKKLGNDDPRHLWPYFCELICKRRPPVIMGEQVTGAAGCEWLNGIFTDLEGEGYAGRAVDIPAASVNAPHIRNRLYWVAHPYGTGCKQSWGTGSDEEGYTSAERFCEDDPGLGSLRLLRRVPVQPAWDACVRMRVPEYRRVGRGGRSVLQPAKQLRIGTGISPLAPRLPNGVGQLRGYGNAIVPQLAAEVIRAYMETYDVDL